MNDDLLEAYRNTIYKVPSLNLEIRIGRITLVLDALLESKDIITWAFITPCNPYSRVLNDDENDRRYEEMEGNITRFIYFTGEGVGEDPTWKPEKSFLILGISKEEAIGLGKKYEQNAIVFGKKNGVAELILLQNDLL